MGQGALACGFRAFKDGAPVPGADADLCAAKFGAAQEANACFLKGFPGTIRIVVAEELQFGLLFLRG